MAGTTPLYLVKHFVPVYMCVVQVGGCTCVCSCVCTCLHVHVVVKGHSSRAIKLPFLKQGLSFSLELTNRLDQLANKPQGSTCLCLPSAGIINVCHHNGICNAISKSHAHGSLLAGQAFYLPSHLLNFHEGVAVLFPIL